MCPNTTESSAIESLEEKVLSVPSVELYISSEHTIKTITAPLCNVKEAIEVLNDARSENNLSESVAEIDGESNKEENQSHEPHDSPTSSGKIADSGQTLQEVVDKYSLPFPIEEQRPENIYSVGSQKSLVVGDLNVMSPLVRMEPQHNIVQGFAEETLEATNTDIVLTKIEPYKGGEETCIQPQQGSCSAILEQIVLSSVTNKEENGFPFIESDNEIEHGEDDVCDDAILNHCNVVETNLQDSEHSINISSDDSVYILNNPPVDTDTNEIDCGEEVTDEMPKMCSIEAIECEQPPLSKRPRLMGQSEDLDKRLESSPDDGSATLLQVLPLESAKPWPILPIPLCRQQVIGGNNNPGDNNDDDDDDEEDSNVSGLTKCDLGVMEKEHSVMEECDQLVPEEVCQVHNSGSSFYSNAQLEDFNKSEQSSTKISTFPLTDQVMPYLNEHSRDTSCFNNTLFKGKSISIC